MSPKQILSPSKRLPAPFWGDNERKRHMLRAPLYSQLFSRFYSPLRAKDMGHVCESKTSGVPVISFRLQINR